MEQQPVVKKRNSGRTGPRTAAGLARSAQNAMKHGSCAFTQILRTESEEGWLMLLDRWLKTYKPAEDSLEYDFVLRTAQAEWMRIRTQRNYDYFLGNTDGLPYNWGDEQIKKHDLLLRYKNSAERSFQREYRLLEQHYKTHCKPAPKEEEKEEKKEKEVPVFEVECFNADGTSTIQRYPFYPPDHPIYQNKVKQAQEVGQAQVGQAQVGQALPPAS